MPALRIRVLVRALAAGCVSFAAFGVPCAAAEAAFQPAWTASPPAINGDADADAWKQGAHLHIGGPDATDAFVLEDAKYLYVAVRARQSEPVRAKQLADEVPLSGDDAAGVAFSSGGESLSFDANPVGAHDATSSADPAFQPAWKSAGRVLAGAYEVTMRIPRALLAGRAKPWSIALERRIAATDRVASTAAVAFGDADSFTVSHDPARVVAGAPGTFSTRYQSLWPSSHAPQLPSDEAGVAVKHSAHGVTVAALDAQNGNREDNAQSVAYTTPNHKLSTSVQRVQSTQDDSRDVLQSLSFLYDNQSNLTVNGGIAVDRAVRDAQFSQGNYAFTDAQYHSDKSFVDLFWSTAGPQFDPEDMLSGEGGTNGFTVRANHQFGEVTVEGSADTYRDDIGTLVNSDETAKISMPLNRHFSLALTTASNYSDAIGAFNENGAQLEYAGQSTNGSVDYRAGRYEDGFLQDSGVTGAFEVPVLGSVTLERRQRNFWSFAFPETMQQLNAVSVAHRFRAMGTLSLSYRDVTGTVPNFVSGATVPGSGLSFSVDRYLKLGLLHFSYNESTAFFSAPSFTLKIIPGARP